MFHVDLMHEVELGIWRSLFIHLLRILECVVGATDELDRRYECLAVFLLISNKLLSRFRQLPTFGRDSIRKFSNNVSELKKLGARDYENILQVSTGLLRFYFKK
jgi:hypothetical protein